MAANTIVLPKRSEVKVEECWDLASLFASEQEWEKGLKKWEKMIPGYARFKGKLALGEDAGRLHGVRCGDRAPGG